MVDDDEEEEDVDDARESEGCGIMSGCAAGERAGAQRADAIGVEAALANEVRSRALVLVSVLAGAGAEAEIGAGAICTGSRRASRRACCVPLGWVASGAWVAGGSRRAGCPGARRSADGEKEEDDDDGYMFVVTPCRCPCAHRSGDPVMRRRIERERQRSRKGG